MSADKIDFEEIIRRIAREEALKVAEERGAAPVSEWLDVPGAMAYTSATEHHVRQLIRKLQAANSDDVYQPNGAGTKPLLVRRAALKDLKVT